MFFLKKIRQIIHKAVRLNRPSKKKNDFRFSRHGVFSFIPFIQLPRHFKKPFLHFKNLWGRYFPNTEEGKKEDGQGGYKEVLSKQVRSVKKSKADRAPVRYGAIKCPSLSL